jgi:glucose/arabinose dehydrogenase
MDGAITRRAAAWITGIVVLVAGSVAALSSGSPAVAVARRAAAESLPVGFADSVVAKIHRPTALAATPDGRIMVADQGGRIRVIENGTLLATPALDISAKVCSVNSERGLLGITLNPQFTSNGRLYVYYTFGKFGSCPIDSADAPVNRVSRFTMVGNTIDPATEKILLDEIINYGGIHNAGDVGMGNDGLLYVSVGDGGCDFTGVSGCEINNTIAQRGNALQGKVLRMTRSGGNPREQPVHRRGDGALQPRRDRGGHDVPGDLHARLPQPVPVRVRLELREDPVLRERHRREPLGRSRQGGEGRELRMERR